MDFNLVFVVGEKSWKFVMIFQLIVDRGIKE